MCGVIGMISKENVNVKLYYGLNVLQHRGQDACGMITSRDNDLFVKKGTGLVPEVLTNDDVDKLEGNIGIGHTRYSTIGKASTLNSQPMFINSTRKIAMAHNGNITNYGELRAALAKSCIFFSTTVDIEPVLHLFTKEYEATQDFFKTAEKVLKKVKGSYSIVGIIAGKGMFAIRDPHGIRPLSLGKNGHTHILSSESVVFQSLGYDFVRDVKPGEAVFIHQDTFDVESKLLVEKKKAHCMFEWVYFARPESMIEERAVYKARLALGVEMAKKLKDEDIDLVVPVPDTARSCAIKIAEMLGVRYREGLIKNRYVGRTFIMPTQQSRTEAVNIKLNPILSVIKDKNIAVVDDSIVRGTTSKRIVKILRDAGAKKIIFVSSCPPIKHPCYYGIDMSTSGELIANDRTAEEIREYIGADKLYYATVDDLLTAIRRDICTACLNAEYPVEVSRDDKTFFEEDKNCR